MQYKTFRIEYLLIMIFLLGFWEPLLANDTHTADRKQESSRMPARLLSSDSSLPAKSTGLNKYVYAELLYQVNFSIPKLVLTGTTISQQLKKTIEVTRYREEALDILGNIGWELVSVITRNFDGGFELFFYFKKPID